MLMADYTTYSLASVENYKMHPNNIPITVDGKTYQSYKECSLALGVCVRTISKYHKAGTLDLLCEVQHKKPLVVDGKEYSSFIECARDIKRHPQTVRKYYRQNRLDELSTCKSKNPIQAWGQTFESQAAAARYKGVSWGTLEHWLNNDWIELTEEERNARKYKKTKISEYIDGKHYTDPDKIARDFHCTKANVFRAIRMRRVHKLGKKIGRGVIRFRVDSKTYTVEEFAKERKLHPATVYRAYHLCKYGDENID